MYNPKRLQAATCICAVSLAVTVLLLSFIVQSSQQQSESLAIKTEPFYIDLQHKLSSDSDFVSRGSILVRPKSEYRPAQASLVQNNELSDRELELLKKASDRDDTYYLRAAYRPKKKDEPVKVTQTIVKSCSLYASNLADFLTVNLNPLNEFISVNLYTTDPECSNTSHQDEVKLPTKFNTTILIETSPLGPKPDTATYIKRLEEERQSKMKEGKEDNRSFLAKYWIYIVPGVIILMMLGGPEQGAR